MRYLVTSAEMKEYDSNTIMRIGVPASVLMERAALAVREEILKHSNGVWNQRVLIAVGSGNNGADGLALARLLNEVGFFVSVYECSNEGTQTETYKLQKQILQSYDIAYVKDLFACDNFYNYVVDGVFGIGLSRAVDKRYGEILQRLNEMNGYKVSIDIPSGIDGTTGRVMGCAFRADMTVTFGFGKRGLYLYPGAEYAGRVVVAGIGIDSHGFFGHIPEMFTYNETPECLLPIRQRDGNKGTFGKILLIAGWEQMAGAGIMSAKAMLMAGAGMVKVYCSEENRQILQCAVPEVMYGNKDSLIKDLEWADVVVAGPGMGQSAEAKEMLEELFERLGRRIVILDADALNLVAKCETLQRSLKECFKKDASIKVIMTPHVGELARISGKEISYIKHNFTEVAQDVAEEYHCVMVCKDARTLVYMQGHPMYLNVVGNNGMATAGSGDVLAGIIAALAAQKMPPFQSASVGVYLHGLAGDLAAENYTEYGVTATGIIGQIKKIISGSGKE